jgi:lysophospholipase L1-like esterase
MKNSSKIFVALGLAALFFGCKIKNSSTIAIAKFLFIGDSLTLGFGLNNQSFADKLKGFKSDIFIEKIAQTGKQTLWMLNKLKIAEAEKRKYDVITIWGGINDIYSKTDFEQTKSNINQMVAIARTMATTVVLINTIPTATYKHTTTHNVLLTKKLNAWLLNFKSNNTIVIDAYALLNDLEEGTKAVYLQPDTLHLNDAGQMKIASAFFNEVVKH